MELVFRFVYTNTQGLTTGKDFYAYTEADALMQYFEWAAETSMTGKLLYIEPAEYPSEKG